jgi:tetratricopeptide (TPR) repeat protein
MHKTFTIVALAIAATSSPLALAEQSPDIARCVELASAGKFADAEPYCAKAAENSGKDGKVLYGDLLARKGDSDAAMKLYTQVLEGATPDKLTPAEFNALNSRALLGLYTGRAGADVDAEASLKLNPNDVELLKTGAQYSKSDSRKLAYADRLVALDPKNAEHHVLRSYVLVSNNQVSDAFEAAEAALKLDPKSATALNARGYARGAMGDYVKAEKDFAAVTRKVPNEPDPWVYRAEVLAKLERPGDAIESANKALNLKPDHERALMLRAHANLALGNAAAALADIQNIKAQEYVWMVGDMKLTAESMISAQNALKPDSVAAMEQNRSIVIGGMASYLHSKCGYFTVPSNVQDEPDNDGLHAYGDCMNQWARTENDEETAKAMSADVIAAAERLFETGKWVEDAENIVCSKMPKKSKCIDDALYSRALAAQDVFDDPRTLVVNAEFDRLNRDIASYNAMVSRFNAASKTASFLQGVANALSAQ